ncbi:hypothetical protein HDU76_000983, partial [Blyttiomyces sp. JEL0837]
IIKTCKRLGIRTVAVYSDADDAAPHVFQADEAVYIGPAQASESYLRGDKIIAAALQAECDAIHPGYGFLSENAEFARAAAENGINFIGPNPDSITAIGDKITSKKLLTSKAKDVPLLPGYTGDDQTLERLTSEALRVGFPLLIKASAGGGGKGMRIVRDKARLGEELAAAQGESQRSFGDSRILLERYVESAKHIEIQIFGDKHGNMIHCFERECSAQRRHQKIIEESPSPFLTPKLREKMIKSATTIGSLINYIGAGTVEFIVDASPPSPGKEPEYFFLEVNTRLQVEHPVTEAITGLDLVELQIWVAMGGSLKDKVPANLQANGHAIECRVYAEDPDNDFFPCTGRVKRFRPLAMEGVRYDSGIAEGSVITISYDPMISKVITHAPTRHQSISLMSYALASTELIGVPTNISFLIALLQSNEFRLGDYNTAFVPKFVKTITSVPSNDVVTKKATTVALAWLISKRARNRGAWKHVPRGFRNVDSGRSQKLSLDVSIDKPFRAGGASHRVNVGYSVQNPIWKGGVRPETENDLKVNLRGEQVSGDVKLGLSEPFESELAVLETVVESTGNFGLQNVTIRLNIDGIQETFSLVVETEQQSGVDHEVISIQSKKWLGKTASIGVVDQLQSDAKSAGDQAINTPSGTVVKTGDAIITIESMKMETKVRARVDGVVNIKVGVNDIVEAGTVIAEIVAA